MTRFGRLYRRPSLRHFPWALLLLAGCFPLSRFADRILVLLPLTFLAAPRFLHALTLLLLQFLPFLFLFPGAFEFAFPGACPSGLQLPFHDLASAIIGVAATWFFRRPDTIAGRHPHAGDQSRAHCEHAPSHGQASHKRGDQRDQTLGRLSDGTDSPQVFRNANLEALVPLVRGVFLPLV